MIAYEEKLARCLAAGSTSCTTKRYPSPRSYFSTLGNLVSPCLVRWTVLISPSIAASVWQAFAFCIASLPFFPFLIEVSHGLCELFCNNCSEHIGLPNPGLEQDGSGENHTSAQSIPRSGCIRAGGTEFVRLFRVSAVRMRMTAVSAPSLFSQVHDTLPPSCRRACAVDLLDDRRNAGQVGLAGAGARLSDLRPARHAQEPSQYSSRLRRTSSLLKY